MSAPPRGVHVVAACLVAACGTGEPRPPGVDPLTGIDCATPASEAPTCAEVELSCGDVVEATTDGGTTALDRTTWAAAQCLDWLAADAGDLDGPERVYALRIPPDTRASVRLQSPCARLDLRAVPTTTVCDAAPDGCTSASGDFADSRLSDLLGGTQGRRYELVVDGYEGEAGAFRLSVTCTQP